MLSLLTDGYKTTHNDGLITIPQLDPKTPADRVSSILSVATAQISSPSFEDRINRDGSRKIHPNEHWNRRRDIEQGHSCSFVLFAPTNKLAPGRE
jgi:hypothetical protein